MVNIMEEKIIGVIPEVRVQGAFGINTYLIYVTTKRLVFIQSSKGYEMVGGMVFGVVGALASAGAAEKSKKKALKWASHQNVDLDALLKSEKGNKEFSLNEIKRIRIKRYNYVNKLMILTLKKNKPKIVLSGVLVPPQEYLKYYKRKGYKKNRIIYKYIKEVESVMNSVLPNKIKSDY
jgi:hypothetical protein